jgi:dihydrofolate synthase/folylpolyglutamate synthase
VILTRPNSKRALSPEELRRAAGRFQVDVEVVENPADALRYALSLAGDGDLVCAAGSLYLVGEVKKLHRIGKGGGTYVVPGDRSTDRRGKF